MDVQMKEDPDEQEEVTIQLFQIRLDRLRQLALASRQAYFARLDFIPAGEKKETWYLGRWGVLDPATLDPIVVDWRRAAVFCCSFQAPPNCEFVGWNTRADGSGRSYMDRQLYEEGNVHQPPDIVHNDSSLTSIHLYAIWRDWSNWRDLF